MNINEATTVALEHLKAGNAHEARKLYNEILTVQPDNIIALHFLGIAAYHEKEYDTAIRCINKALLLKPSYAEAHNNLGIVYQAVGQADQAIACYQKALSFNPHFVEGHINLANTLEEKELLDDAIVCYQKALQINPHILGINQKLALIYQKKRRFEEAIICCLKELQLDPSNTNVQFILGTVFLTLGQVDESISCYRKFLNIGPDTSSVRILSEINFKKNERLEDAIAAYNKATGFSILISVSAFNRKKITQLALEQIKRYKTSYCHLQVYNDHSTEYGNTFLEAYADEVVQLPDKMGIHDLRMHQFRRFLETDFDLLYMTDNDVLHDPDFVAALEVLYEMGNCRLPVGIFNSSAHMSAGNIMYHGNGILLRKFSSGVSMLFNKQMVERIVSLENKSSAAHNVMAWDYKAMLYLGLPWMTSETSYLEHFGGGGIHNRDFAGDRALQPTKYLRERWQPIVNYLAEDVELEISF
jgi:tetratricopeptide (TPR) repeat protein